MRLTTTICMSNFLHKGDHVHLGYGLRSRRLTDPALTLAQLPPIDLVVLSHLHEDHFDTLVQKEQSWVPCSISARRERCRAIAYLSVATRRSSISR